MQGQKIGYVVQYSAEYYERYEQAVDLFVKGKMDNIRQLKEEMILSISAPIISSIDKDSFVIADAEIIEQERIIVLKSLEEFAENEIIAGLKSDSTYEKIVSLESTVYGKKIKNTYSTKVSVRKTAESNASYFAELYARYRSLLIHCEFWFLSRPPAQKLTFSNELDVLLKKPKKYFRSFEVESWNKKVNLNDYELFFLVEDGKKVLSSRLNLLDSTSYVVIEFTGFEDD